MSSSSSTTRTRGERSKSAISGDVRAARGGSCRFLGRVEAIRTTGSQQGVQARRAASKGAGDGSHSQRRAPAPGAAKACCGAPRERGGAARRRRRQPDPPATSATRRPRPRAAGDRCSARLRALRHWDGGRAGTPLQGSRLADRRGQAGRAGCARRHRGAALDAPAAANAQPFRAGALCCSAPAPSRWRATGRITASGRRATSAATGASLGQGEL